MNLKNVLTIAKKELRAYLVNVSNFLVLAGVLLVTAFLFFNTFYSVGVSQLDDLFGLFPWVFAILIPAVSMGVIAKERQEKTLYYLFSQPINEIEIILGKFIGSFVFFALFSSFSCFDVLRKIISGFSFKRFLNSRTKFQYKFCRCTSF